MSRITYVLIDGELVTKAVNGVTTDEYSKLSSKTNPYAGYGKDTLGNNINGLLNHADGKYYDSKSQFERAVRARGCRIVGNDLNKSEWKTPLERGVKGDFNARNELKQALQQVRGC